MEYNRQAVSFSRRSYFDKFRIHVKKVFIADIKIILNFYVHGKENPNVVRDILQEFFGMSEKFSPSVFFLYG